MHFYTILPVHVILRPIASPIAVPAALLVLVRHQHLEAVLQALDGGGEDRLAPGDDLAVPDQVQQVLEPGVKGSLLQGARLEAQRSEVAHD